MGAARSQRRWAALFAAAVALLGTAGSAAVQARLRFRPARPSPIG